MYSPFIKSDPLTHIYNVRTFTNMKYKILINDKVNDIHLVMTVQPPSFSSGEPAPVTPN